MFRLTKKTKRIAIFIAIIFVLLPLKKSYAQRFSWSGMIELSFRDRIEKGKAGDYETKTEQQTFQQRYFLNINGPLVDPRIAIFSIGTTFAHTWEDLNDAQGNIRDYGYNIAATLFPQRFFPLTLYTNRFASDSDSSVYGSRNTITTGYGLRWSLLFRGALPSIRLLMEQLETENNDPLTRKNEIKREASLELNRVTSASVFFARYRYENIEDKISSGTSDTQGVDMNYGSQITNILHLRTFGSYNTTTSKDVRGKDDINTGIGLFFNPTIYLDLSTDYNFNYLIDESYYGGAWRTTTSNRHLSSTMLYFHPDPRFDTRLGYYYAKSISTTELDNNRISLNILGRPITGLNLMGDAAYLESRSTLGSSILQNNSQHYGAGYSYTMPYKNFSFNSSYRFNYSLIDVEPGEDGFTTTHTAGAGIAYNLAVALITTDYQFLSSRESRVEAEDRDEHRYRISLASYYIRGLAVLANFEYGNLMQQKNDAPWTGNEIISFASSLDYNIWRGLFFSGGYSMYDYSNPASNDSEILYVEGRLLIFLLRNLFGTGRVRQEWINYSLSTDKNILTAEAKLDYRIRKLLLSAEYSYSLETQGPMETTKNTVFLRVTRSF